MKVPGASATRRERGAFHRHTLLHNLMAPPRGHTLASRSSEQGGPPPLTSPSQVRPRWPLLGRRTMAEGRTSKLDFLAYHEAGHAAVAFSFGLRLEQVRIEPDDELAA